MQLEPRLLAVFINLNKLADDLSRKNNDDNLMTMCGDALHWSITLHGSTHAWCTWSVEACP